MLQELDRPMPHPADDPQDQEMEGPGPSRLALAKEIRDFLERTGWAPTPFGIAAAKDDKLLQRIECAPRGISMDKADKIRRFMADWDKQKNGHRSRHRKQKTQAG